MTMTLIFSQEVFYFSSLFESKLIAIFVYLIIYCRKAIYNGNNPRSILKYMDRKNIYAHATISQP